LFYGDGSGMIAKAMKKFSSGRVLHPLSLCPVLFSFFLCFSLSLSFSLWCLSCSLSHCLLTLVGLQLLVHEKF
jgi:hypothetical protein